MAPVLFILALLAPTAFASTTANCLNVTLPGILNLGQCYGNSLNLCSTSTSGIVTALTKLVTCLTSSLSNINIMAVVSAISDIVILVLKLLNLGFLVKPLTDVLPRLCAITNTTGCATLLSGNATCSEPISLTLPDTLSISKCVNQTLLLCQNGTVASDRLLLNLINTLTCLLTTLLGSNPGSMLAGLGCTVLGLLERVQALAFVVSFLKGPLGCP